MVQKLQKSTKKCDSYSRNKVVRFYGTQCSIEEGCTL